MSTTTTGATLVLTARDVADLLDLPSCIEAVEQALIQHDAGQSLGPSSLGLTLADGSFHVKAAALSFDGHAVIAAKANVNLPGNPARHGLPTIQGVLSLLDGHSGRPLAVMDSIVITSVRTGAATAVAARWLALAGADTVTVVGCGEQGDVQLRSLAAVRPIRRALVVDVDRDKARDFARRISSSLGIAIEATTDISGALANSQVCLMCTTASQAIVGPEDAHPGLFIAAVGADNPTKQELDPRLVASSRVVVDSLASCAAGGELHHAIDAGLMSADDVHGELAAVVSGRVAGRTREDDVFVFDSTGTALQDVAAAMLVYRQALAAGRGVEIPLSAR